jgi:hypothetical protein
VALNGDKMSEKFAIIAGVSSYMMKEATNLPFCKNDLLAMENH